MEGTFLIFCLLLSLAETSFQFRINLLNKMDETKKQNGLPPQQLPPPQLPPPQLPPQQLPQLPPMSPAQDHGISSTNFSSSDTNWKYTSTITVGVSGTDATTNNTNSFPTSTTKLYNNSTETPTITPNISPTYITTNPPACTDSSIATSQASTYPPTITHKNTKTMTSSGSSKKFTRPPTWKIVLKINDTFHENMSIINSVEYDNIKDSIYESLTNSCTEVIGYFFLGLDGTMTFKNGSIVIETPLQINGDFIPSTNDSWESSLKKTIPLYIPGSFNISFVGNSTTSTTPTPENFATRIAIGCGVGGTVLVIVAVTLVFVWYRKRQSGLAKRPVKEKNEISTNISLSIPTVNAGLMWRESSGVSSMSTAPKSESFNRHSNVSQAEDNDEPSSLHRKEHYSDSVITDLMFFQLPVNPVQRQITEYSQSTSSSDGKTKRFPGERFPQEDDAHRSKFKLPRIEITPVQINKQFNDLSQKSQPQPILDRRNKIILNHQMTTNPTGYGSTPADFGGLFVPGNSSDFYQTSSYGSMPNMSIYQVSENIEDVDLKNISNEGELFSLTPRTDTNIMTRISTITKNIFTKNKNDMLHRSNLTGRK